MPDFDDQFEPRGIEVHTKDWEAAHYASGRLRGYREGKLRGWQKGWEDHKRLENSSAPGLLMMHLGLGAALANLFSEAGWLAPAVLITVGWVWGTYALHKTKI